MKNTDQASRFLVMANKDLGLLRVAVNSSEIDDEIVGFHVQQAVEKGLKALLTYLNIGFPKTHDLLLLMDLLEANDINSLEKWHDLVDYTDFGVQYRYEAFESSESMDRESVVKALSEFLEFVKTQTSI